MAIEVANYITQLVETNPPGPDDVGEGDDHIRLLKSVLKTTFPAISGQVTADYNEINRLDGIQTHDPVTLADIINTFNIGAESGTHLGVSGNEIQAKISPNAAGTLYLNRLGGGVRIGAQSGVGGVDLYRDAVRTVRSEINSLRLYSNAATNPAIEGQVHTNDLTFFNSDNDQLGYVGYRTSGEMRFENSAWGAGLRFRGADSAGNTEDLLRMRDDFWIAYYAGLPTLALSTGIAQVRGVLDEDVTVAGASNDAELRLTNQSGAIASRMVNAGSTLYLEHWIPDAPILIRGTNAAGSRQRAFASFNNGGVVASGMYFNDELTFNVDAERGVIRSLTSPADGAPHNVRFALTRANGTEVARIGYSATSQFDIRAYNHGADMRFFVEDENDVLQQMLTLNPDTLRSTFGGHITSGPLSELVQDDEGLKLVRPVAGTADARLALANGNGGIGLYQRDEFLGGMFLAQLTSAGAYEKLIMDFTRNGGVRIRDNGVTKLTVNSSGIAVDGQASITGDIAMSGGTITGLAASETEPGIVELATDAETIAGTDDAKALTPAGFATFQSNTATGHCILPGNIQIAWGPCVENVSKSFSRAFSSAPHAIVITDNTGASVSSTPSITAKSASAFTFRIGDALGSNACYFLAIGVA